MLLLFEHSDRLHNERQHKRVRTPLKQWQKSNELSSDRNYMFRERLGLACSEVRAELVRGL